MECSTTGVIVELITMMADFVCQGGWPTGGLHSCSNIISGCTCGVSGRDYHLMQKTD